MFFWRRKKKEGNSSESEAPAAKARNRSKAAPSDPKVLEFGGPVSAGEGVVMKGQCKVEEVEGVQACIWRLEAAPGTEAPQPQPKYHIEF